MLILHLGIGMQWLGALLLTALFLLLTRSLKRPWLSLWLGAWACLLAAMTMLRVAFTVDPNPKPLIMAYLACEYGFGLLLLAGMASFVSGRELRPRDARLLAPFLAFSVIAPVVIDNFNLLFSVHAGVLAGLFGAALVVASRAPHESRGPGLIVLTASLAGLTLVFLHYVPTFAMAAAPSPPRWLDYLTRAAFLDLILQLLLGIGSVMVTLERINRELDDANQRLALLARHDPLTSALNRHAFHGMRAGDPCSGGGVVVLVDIDNLKGINDSGGHGAGDRAIRAVATALRSVIRSDDLLFRWGGDEFLVILAGVDETQATARLATLDRQLELARGEGGPLGLPLSVSYGLASFDSVEALEGSVAAADERMYRRRRDRRGSPGTPSFAPSPHPHEPS
ncbi:MAG: GGDEF domain-containing protein [Thermoanaerobaculales bacterium]|jgi:diguanylate cyclase (GGDEF)-like protein|nr:GGDEF domain-containing protein [Thermoanaerobaculales bacterium]MCU0305792.1 GGDEF domain-containing protein [Thermoanaerobaculales bacterium]